MKFWEKMKKARERKNYEKWLRTRRHRIEIQGDKMIVVDKLSGETFKRSTIKLLAAMTAAADMAKIGCKVDEIIIDGMPWAEYIKQIFGKKK